jgi:tRNA A-37 threonylcarbamoyl transferase component Bud32/tetratricopeptide (TPR) repeat protein
MSNPTADLLESLLDRQSRSWLAGGRPTVEELLDGSSLRDDPEAQLDLIYNEIVLREELSEDAPADEYLRRFPHLRHDLELHFEVHRAVGEGVLSTTRPVSGTPTLAEVDAPARPPDYDLIEPIGRGGMAVVYKARHRRLRRVVALKMFEPGRVPSPREVLRFRAEAEAIARLRHPNIVQIYEIGDWDGLPFLALELADQGTLARRLQQLPFTPRAAAELVEALARAVQHAHDAGVVHRDLKPANVLLASPGRESGEWTPKVTDFGLAKVLQEDPDTPRDETRTGDPIGTPRYMAPEQAAGRNDRIGPATDVYALGNLLYECLTGRVPFLAAIVVETLDQIRTADPPPPRRFQPSVPRDLETIALKCLAKEPEKRYATAAALADDLRRYLDGRPIQARPTPAWERAWKWCRRRPTYAALLAVAFVLMGAGAAAAEVQRRAERERIARLRDGVESLVKEGQEALARDEDEVAEARFRDAWVRVLGEPALRDYQTGVAGWLDHSRRALNRQHWKQRVPPREYDEKRDEALFLGLLLEGPRGDAVRAAREAVAEALELTLPDDGWLKERERLVLLDADLIRVEAGPAKALERLDGTHGFASRLFHSRRSGYLEELGRKEEAAAERRRAASFPPEEVAVRSFTGTDLLRRGDFAGAGREFEAVLDAEPEHFAARLSLAVCALRQGRPAEARVGLTACIAQRPRFAWSYLYRGQCSRLMGDVAGERRDTQRADELRPGIARRGRS